MQEKVLTRLGSWYEKKKLPFVVFRQNNTLDELDGVDNALRSYLIAEYLYKRYIPCLKADQFDLWIDRRLANPQECESKLLETLALDPDLRGRLEPLSPDYLQQHIAYYALPYTWANVESTSEPELETRVLDIENGNFGKWLVRDKNKALGCGENACYLDLEVATDSEQEATVSFLSSEQLSFTLYPGEHRYRIRMSLLWHWYQADTIPSLELKADSAIQLRNAQIVVLETE